MPICPPLSDLLGPQRQHSSMNPVLGAARHLTGTVDTPREAAHPPRRRSHRSASDIDLPAGLVNTEPVKGKRVDQLGDGRATVNRQVQVRT